MNKYTGLSLFSNPEFDSASCPALFGSNPVAGLVHVDYLAPGRSTCWYRHGEVVERSEEDFASFLWTNSIAKLKDFPGTVSSERLSGEADYGWLVETPDYETCVELNKYLTGPSGLAYSKAGKANGPTLFIADPVLHYLMASGKTLYGGMSYEDVRRLYLVPFCTRPEGQELAECLDSPLEMVALAYSDSRCECLRLADYASESELLYALVEKILAYDPDVIEGYELYNEVLPYLSARAKDCKVKLNLGRADHTGCPASLISRASKVQIAEKSFAYTRWDTCGRDLVDTWLYVRLYDVSSRELESFELPAVARQLGIAVPEPLDWADQNNGEEAAQADSMDCGSEEQPSLFTDLWAADLESGNSSLFANENNAANGSNAKASFSKEEVALAYAALLREVAGVLAYPHFIQAQFYPYSYQNTVLRGNATRINSLFLREYYRNKCSIPFKPEVQSFAGGLTIAQEEGLAEHVLHCDVQSLYPSVMLTFDIKPKGDTLNILLTMLAQLREFRLLAKGKQRAAQAAPDSEEKNGRVRFYQALQSTFKLLINSFYGYLGFNMGNFADFAAAAEVTKRGRELLLSMIEWLSSQGCRILEVDTDGIYFQPGSAMDLDWQVGFADQLQRRQAEQLIERLNLELPEGINVELDGFFRSMLCHKMKNYALMDYDQAMTIRGAGLRSRATEPYLRETLQEMLRLALLGRQAEIPELLNQVANKIAAKKMPILKLAKNDTLVESLESYAKKIEGKARNRSAAYELALGSGRNYRAGDIVSYYITGTKAKVVVFESAKLVSSYDETHPDVNTKYYIGKLTELHKRFAPALGLAAWKPNLK